MGRWTGIIKAIKNYKEGANHYPILRNYTVTVIKTVWSWWRDRHIDWNRIGNSQVALHKYGHMIFWQKCNSVVKE